MGYNTLIAVAVSLALSGTAKVAVAEETSVAQASGFVVSDIRVDGLQRVSEGTVYNYLPVNIGDKLTPQRIREAVRAMYETGFFRDVELRRDKTTLVVTVVERPSIESFEIKGNKDIKTEDLTKSMRNVGLATGKTFDRSVLEDVKQYLTDQYFSRGKYAVKIDASVEDVPGNRVKVKIDIKEGKRAKIRQINLVGNTTFRDKDILQSFELRTPNWLSWYKQNDRYSRESLQGDLEKLRSFYMDRGYANFDVDSTQVAIAPEKDDIFITINVNEGEVFKIADVKLAGTFVGPRAELQKLVLVSKGQIFSRKMITATQELIQNRLGADGYAFAKVDPVPTPDNDKKNVSLTFFVDPGNRVYVRHIVFNGVTKINDEVLRREMRQLEGGWLSNVSVERSKQRLQRLPFIEKVESNTKPVPGSADMVDVEFDVKEGPSAQLGGGIGYSQSQSFVLNGNYADSNFMGTGERVQIDLNTGRYSKVYGVSHTNPYTTIDGIARTLSFTYRNVTQFVSSSSDFSSKTFTLAADYGYPIGEFQGLHGGISANAIQLLTSSAGSALQAQSWTKNNGNVTTSVVTNYGVYPTPIDRSIGVINPDATGSATFYSNKFRTYQVSAGWNYDSRNRGLFADRGSHHAVSLSYALPGSQVRYWLADYEALQYLPLGKRITMSFQANASYGTSIGRTTALPPYLQFYGGGPDSVRGFTESRLGPKDNFGNPFGGNLKVVGRAELILPTPEKWKTSARVGLFYDIGNVFSTGHRYTFYGVDGVTPVDYSFRFKDLKRSVGLGVQWLAPLGIFRFSFAVPLNAKPSDGIHYADEVERFQFSVGQAF